MVQLNGFLNLMNQEVIILIQEPMHYLQMGLFLLEHVRIRDEDISLQLTPMDQRNGEKKLVIIGYYLHLLSVLMVLFILEVIEEIKVKVVYMLLMVKNLKTPLL